MNSHTCLFRHEHAHDTGICLACEHEQEQDAYDNEDSLVTVEFDRTVTDEEQELIDEIDSCLDEFGDIIDYR